ncbi:hypothetical protein [Actinoplanes utahensis]|uniref:hypothetical protein n=1 Tax=Actinoplanes utahensis TaxID=1869 RepID=UPI001F15F43D|nr:hypothetical protein [Actinoplanes utahensis]
MTPHDDHSQRRQPLFFPVVIATVLLTIVGMVGGYLLAEQRERASEPVPSDSASDFPSEYPSGPPVKLVGKEPCIPETQTAGERAGAVGELRRVLYLKTKKSEVWICQDQAGSFYYHANRGSRADWVENTTALFLHNAQPDGRGGYTATAVDGKVFSVNSARLRITALDGASRVEEAVPE